MKMTYATAVAIDQAGVLIIGPSGSGKSDLALRLIDRSAILVSDDIVFIDDRAGRITLYPAANIEGKIEMRGVGIVSVPYCQEIGLRLVVDLNSAPDRFPVNLTYKLHDFLIPCVAISAFEASAPLKIEHSLRSLVDGDVFPVATRAIDCA